MPEVSAAFVAPMEDVLEVYAEPYDPTRPKVNFDETTKQRMQETRQPLPAQPGQPQRYDDEYARNGTRNLFLFVAPQAGWRHGQVTAQRTKRDFAHAMQWLVDEGYPEATVIRVCWTISIRIRSPRCLKRSSLPKRGASHASWSSTPPPSMGVG